MYKAKIEVDEVALDCYVRHQGWTPLMEKEDGITQEDYFNTSLQERVDDVVENQRRQDVEENIKITLEENRPEKTKVLKEK